MLSPRPQRSQSGFTLAELLVVIVLVGIMFVIALPALLDITGQSKLDSAANGVHSACSMARQHALTHGQPTYVVFNEGQTDPALAYRAYAVFTINTHTNVIDQSAGYFLTNWEMLPPGVVFDNISGQAGNENIFYPTGGSWNGAISKNNRLRIQGADYIVQGFRPNGEAGSSTHWIFLAEGTVQNAQPGISALQGKQIRFGITGQSRILDTLYDESGEAKAVKLP